MADKRKKLSELLDEETRAAGGAGAADLFESRPWTIAKKSALVDVPASTIGLAGLLESGAKFMQAPGQTSENVFDQNKAAAIFSGLAERHGLLPENSQQIEPRGAAERAAGIGTRVIANPLSYIGASRGVPVVARNLAGGLAGETAAEMVAAQGGGGLAQTGAGFAADSLLMALSPKARAGFLIHKMNLGPEGAKEVGEALSIKLDNLTDAERAAWREFDLSATGTTMPGDVLRDVGEFVEDQTKYAPGATRPEVATTVRKNLPQDVDVAELQKVRSAAREEAAQAMQEVAPKKQIARHAGTVRETADAMIDVIAQISPADADAVAKLKAARAASKSRADLFPEESRLYRSFFGGKARDNAQEAVATLLASPQRKTEIGLVMRALQDTPTGQRAFRRAFVQAVLSMPEEVAGTVGVPALRKLDKFSDVSVQVLGKDGAKQLRKRLAEGSSASATGDATLAMARQAGIPWQVSRMLGGGMAAAGAALAAGASPGQVGRSAGVGAVVLPSLVYLSEKFGPRAAREAAMQGLLDGEMYRVLTRPLGGRSLPAYTKDLERAVVARGLHLGLPDDEKDEK